MLRLLALTPHEVAILCALGGFLLSPIPLMVCWLWKRNRGPQYTEISGVRLDVRDIKHFAGQTIAVDAETHEILLAAPSSLEVRASMRERHLGRPFFWVCIPGNGQREVTDE